MLLLSSVSIWKIILKFRKVITTFIIGGAAERIWKEMTKYRY